MNLISGIDITAGALNAQKTRLDIVAQNIANTSTTRTPGGGPYVRQVVSFETEMMRRSFGGGPALQSVKVGTISADRTPGQQVYDPQHADATSEGLDLITASRAYEANLSVVKNARQMAMKTLEIGK